MSSILGESFGQKAAGFNYSENGYLKYNGDVKSFTKQEKEAYDELNNLLKSKTVYNIIFTNSVSFKSKDGKDQTVNTGNDGSKGDAAIYPSKTQNGEGILAVNPNITKAGVADVRYDEDGNQQLVNLNDGIAPPIRSFTPFENFWHGVGHEIAGSDNNLGKAMEVENKAGAIHKIHIETKMFNFWIPASIPSKPYNLNHPKK